MEEATPFRPGALGTPSRPAGGSPAAFAVPALALALAAVLLAGWTPVGFSLVTVFLFAGPHNWLEFRYFLARMPARWGPLRPFFTLAIGGALVLTLAYAGLPWAARGLGWDTPGWMLASSAWNSALVLWVAGLAHLRGAERKERDWSWVWAPAFLLVGLVWALPGWWDVGLVYLHPLVALAFLQRELRRRRPEWLPAYYLCLACVPLLLGLLWWRLAASPSLPGEDALTARITRHAGAAFLQGVSSHLLVSTHTFLEMLHYGVWILAIPLVGLRSAPWKLDTIPLFRRSPGWRRGVLLFSLGGIGLVLALWACFVADYPATRDIYFTVAIFHVLAEFPFFLRAL